MPRKKIDTTTSDYGNNPELAETIEAFKQEMLTEITRIYGVFKYDKEGENTNEMPSAIKDDVFNEYPDNAFSEFTKDSEKRTFHNRNHTEKVILRIEALCEAINNYAKTNNQPEIVISPNIKNILIIAAAAHDLDQSSDVDDIKGKVVTNLRSYDSGNNEKRSATTVVKKVEEKIKSIIHDSKEAEHLLAILEAAIIETGPHPNFANGTVQQQFDDSKPWQTHLLAYADIGAAGMNPETFITEGDAFLLELHPFVLKAFAKYSAGSSIDEITKKEVTEKIKAWDLGQIKWVKDREAKFNGPWTDTIMTPPKEFPADIDLVPPEVKKALQPLFSNFSESARLAEDRQKKRAEMTFEQLAENLGFRK